MYEPTRTTSRPIDQADLAIRRSWWTLSGTFALLAAVVLLKAVLGGAGAVDWLTACLVLVAGVAAIRHRNAVASLEAGRRSEAESFARILSGLSRSISPDAIVDAIVAELAHSTGADHVVVVRRRDDARHLEATLVSARPGVKNSTTLLPISDLEEPVGDDPEPPAGSDLVAIPIEPAFVGAAAPVGAAMAALGAEPPRPGLALSALPAVPSVAPWRARTRPAPPAQPATGARPADAEARALVVTDRIAERVRRVYGLRAVIAAPLASDGEVHGAIVLSRRVADPWSETARRLLTGAAREASMALSRAYSHRAAEQRASTDALTGLPNRRYFDEFCGLLARRRRADDALGVLMIDIDHFKRLNDTYGHAVGDEVLRAVGGAIVSAVREDDVPARFGGEEFVVLLRNPGHDVALEVGERVRHAVGGLDLRRFDVPSISVSVGVAVARAADEPIAALVARADAALYRAKRAGRDRVVDG